MNIFSTSNIVCQQKSLTAFKPNCSSVGIKFNRQQKLRKIINQKTQSNIYIPQLNLIKISSPKNKHFDRRSIKHYKPIVINNKQTNVPMAQSRELNEIASEAYLNVQQQNRKKDNSTPFRSIFKSQNSDDSESFDSQIQKEQLLLLQIKQLKRQNTFLKKKIRQLNATLYGSEQFDRGKSSSIDQKHSKKQKKGFSKQNLQSLELSANIFFQQIKNLLNSVSQLFKIKFTAQQIIQFQSNHLQQSLSSQICPIKRHQILRKYYLKRKLDKIALHQQSQRYQIMLGLFMDYYQNKELSQRKIVQSIDSMIMYTSDLNKWLIEKASKNKIKTQLSIQNHTPRDVFQHIQIPTFDTLTIPPNSINHVAKMRGNTLSPITKVVNQYQQKQ